MAQSLFCRTGIITPNNKQLFPCYYPTSNPEIFEVMSYGFNDISNQSIRVPPNVIVESSDDTQYVGSYLYQNNFPRYDSINASEITKAPSKGYNVIVDSLDGYLRSCANRDNSSTPEACQGYWDNTTKNDYFLPQERGIDNYILNIIGISIAISISIIVIAIILICYQRNVELEI